MTSEYQPNGDVVVTIGDELVWTPLDVFTWVAFGERRGGATLPKIIFPPNEWSHDWAHWPPQNMLAALNEVWSGVAWKPPLGSHDAAFADADREWARSTIERTGYDAHTLAEALVSDIGRAEQAVDRYHNARQAVMSAVRQGHLQVWGCRALAFGKPDQSALPELLSPRLFTHDPREVNEAAWVQMASGVRDDGPWWDRVRFDKDNVLALWPMNGGVVGCTLPANPVAGTEILAHQIAEPPSALSKGDGLVKASIVGENKLQTFLEAEMRASPQISPGKKIMLERASKCLLDQGYRFSNIGFRRAWANAVAATNALAWSKAGAKPKSKRVIE